MDPVTHGLVGAVLGSLKGAPGGPAEAQAVFWTAVLGAVMPDVDIVTRLTGGEIGYLEKHRGVTHSIPGLLVLSAASAVLVKVVWPGASWTVLFARAIVGALSHVFLDIQNSYGTRFLWPFSNRRLAWDTLMIVDLPILLLTLAGLIGAAYNPSERTRVTWLVLSAMAFYLILRLYIHGRILGAAHRRFSGSGLGGPQPLKISVTPGLLGIGLWNFVVEAPDRFVIGEARPFTRGKVFDILKELPRDTSDPFFQASRKARATRIFLDFARHPWRVHEKRDGRHVVTWGDLRFWFRNHPVFTVTVIMDDQMQILSTRLGRGMGRT
ncbi:MAG: metal-dependent hydrolase [Actinobacteria bacterium]|nr:metal-dependent hydrolase [Actinomycetota bacterium]